jgi:hypothetical protein
MSIRRLLQLGGITFSVLCGGLIYVGAPALALKAYGQSSSFGVPGSGAGQLALRPRASGGGNFAVGSGVAVNDTTHDVYVGDTGNARMDEFDQNGNFIRAWGYGVADGATHALQTCTTSCFAGIPGSGEGQLVAPTAVAVDNSGGASNGDVYVADARGTLAVVEKFGPSGEYLSTISAQAGQEIEYVEGVVVDTNGNLWLSDELVTNRLINIAEFDPNGTGIMSVTVSQGQAGYGGLALDLSDNVYTLSVESRLLKFSPTGESLGFGDNCKCADGLSFDIQSGNLFTDRGTSVAELDTSGNIVQQFGSGALAGGQGIAVDSVTGSVYVADSTKGVVDIFPVVTLPSVGVNPPSSVRRTSLTLNGTVTPEGIEASGVQFEYGATSGYGTTVAAVPSTCSSSETECGVSVTLSGLQVGTTYHYRLDASNVNGIDKGQDATFTTAPAVSGVNSGSVSSLTATSATITGSLEPEGNETHYYCQYGLGTSYGSVSPAPPGTQTSANGNVPATCMLSGLEPRKAYHFRLVATNAYGTTLGEDKELSMPSAPPSIDRQLTSVVTQTSATINALINPNNEATTYHFEYGPTVEYGTSFASANIGSGYGDIHVGASLVGLLLGTTYHFRVVATNTTGTTYGPDQTFVTLPVALPLVETQSASGVSPNGASLSGTVDPQSVQSFYEFDLGTDTGYGTRVFGDAGFGAGPVTVTVSFQNLAAGTTYHYRLVASNVYGVIYGPDRTFTTLAYPTAVLGAPLSSVLIPIPTAVFPSGVASGGVKTKHATKARPKKKAKKRKVGRTARKAGRHHGGRGRSK